MPQIQAVYLNPAEIRDISPLLLDASGKLKIVDAEVLAHTTKEERALFGVKHACYGLPTTELVAHLKALIAGRRALEIGAGNGILAEALGIPATDNFQQTWPEIKAHYDALRQPVIAYGSNVENLSAEQALKKYKPEVVVACWVTHRYNPERHWDGGNQDGVDEKYVLANCQHYLFVGNEAVHRNKAIWSDPHEKTHPEFLYSRAANGSKDFMAVWTGMR